MPKTECGGSYTGRGGGGGFAHAQAKTIAILYPLYKSTRRSRLALFLAAVAYVASETLGGFLPFPSPSQTLYGEERENRAINGF